MNKRGQLYLLAAIIMCLAIYGVVKVQNKIEVPYDPEFSFFIDNFKGERTQVINLGYIKEEDYISEHPDNLLKIFTEFGWNTGAVFIKKTGSNTYDVINYLNEPIEICPEEGICQVESGALEQGGQLTFGFGEGRNIKVIDQNLEILDPEKGSFKVVGVTGPIIIKIGQNIYNIGSPEKSKTIIFKDIDENFKRVEIV